jgi:hypothetical protein
MGLLLLLLLKAAHATCMLLQLPALHELLQLCICGGLQQWCALCRLPVSISNLHVVQLLQAWQVGHHHLAVAGQLCACAENAADEL